MNSDTQTRHDVQDPCAWQQRMAHVMPGTDWQSATRKRGTAASQRWRDHRKQRPGAIRHSAFDQAEFQPIVEAFRCAATVGHR